MPQLMPTCQAVISNLGANFKMHLSNLLLRLVLKSFLSQCWWLYLYELALPVFERFSPHYIYVAQAVPSYI